MAERGAPKGNTNARKGKMWFESIRKRITDRQAMEKLADKLIDEALGGNMVAMKEIGDRLDGKPLAETKVDVTDRTDRPVGDTELGARIAYVLRQGLEAEAGRSSDGEHSDLGATAGAADPSVH